MKKTTATQTKFVENYIFIAVEEVDGKFDAITIKHFGGGSANDNNTLSLNGTNNLSTINSLFKCMELAYDHLKSHYSFLE